MLPKRKKQFKAGTPLMQNTWDVITYRFLKLPTIKFSLSSVQTTCPVVCTSLFSVASTFSNIMPPSNRFLLMACVFGLAMAVLLSDVQSAAVLRGNQKGTRSNQLVVLVNGKLYWLRPTVIGSGSKPRNGRNPTLALPNPYSTTFVRSTPTPTATATPTPTPMLPTPISITTDKPFPLQTQSLPVQSNTISDSFIIRTTAVCSKICQRKVQIGLSTNEATASCVLRSATFNIGKVHLLYARCGQSSSRYSPSSLVSTDSISTSIKGPLATFGIGITYVANDFRVQQPTIN